MTIIQRWKRSGRASIKGINNLLESEVTSLIVCNNSLKRGEFLENRCTITVLNAQDVQTLIDEGFYKEPPVKEAEDDDYVLKARLLSSNSKKQREQVYWVNMHKSMQLCGKILS